MDPNTSNQSVAIFNIILPSPFNNVDVNSSTHKPNMKLTEYFLLDAQISNSGDTNFRRGVPPYINIHMLTLMLM